MTPIRTCTAATTTLLGLICVTGLAAQPTPTNTTVTAVPRLIRISSSFHPANGQPVTAVEGATLAIYRDEVGGSALWQETQNVAVDAEGRYTVVMGSISNDGVPLDLFAAGEPRWLGVTFNRPGETEQPRVRLASVPYALKAADAETLGGKPASAYLLVPPATSAGAAPASATTGSAKPTTSTPHITSGTANTIAMFTNTMDLGNSVMYQSNGNVGLSTTQPAIALDVRTGSLPQMGIAGVTDYLTFFASDTYGPAIYWGPAKDMRFGKGGPGLYNPYGFTEQMRIQSSTGNVGIGTLTPGSKLDVAGDINVGGGLRLLGSPVLGIPGGLPSRNIALGIGALPNNTTGSNNTAVGSSALLSNTTGTLNTATGSYALQNNTIGAFNTADGLRALEGNTTGCCNTANGGGALASNTTGHNNTATGWTALGQNTTGAENTALGTGAGWSTTGSRNIAVGFAAGGYVAGDMSNNIHIGSPGAATDSGAIRIGTPGTQTSFFAAGVRSVTTSNADAIPVVIDSAGQLGTVSSSQRFKEDIRDMSAASDGLMRLHPVTFRYTKPYADGSKPIQYGLIAEEVAEVYPDLVARSADGQIETVKYQVLDSMLLNEVQKQRQKIEQQEAAIRTRRQEIEALQARLAGMSALESRVASLEAHEPRP